MAGSARYTAFLDANTLYPAPLRDLLLSLAVDGLELPDAEDRHVLAAAITGHVDAIVTFNLKDFPGDVLGRYNIEAQHPDEFVLNQLELRQIDALAAIKAMRARLRRPPQSAVDLIATLERAGLPASAAHLRRAQALI